MAGPFTRRPDWLTGFDLPDAPTGAVMALDLGPAGLWAARIVDGAAVAADTESRIHPGVLDARIAGYLRDTGRVEVSDDAVFAALMTVAAHAREALADRDTALVMGGEGLRLVTVTIDDVVEATVPEANRAHGMIVELAGPLPVDAVLLGPGLDDWPGLWEALTERGFSALMPGDRFPETFGGDDAPTDLLDAVPPQPEVRAWDNSGQNAALVDPADYGLDRFGNTVDVYRDEAADEPSTRGAEAEGGDDDSGESAPGMRGRMIAAAAVTLLAVGGGGVALALNANVRSGPEATSTKAREADGVAAMTPTSTLEHINSSVSPADLAAARAPMAKYTTPPPPPPPKPTSTRTAVPKTGPEPQAPTTHRRRIIPNPIPGFPPIVIG
ncbi:hypothetical protein [Gordonia aichiensis]|uniref:hypothetical protein n=1 Tax=Gordonia aichiensis TaxID=36820 RepID=UPI0032645835